MDIINVADTDWKLFHIVNKLNWNIINIFYGVSLLKAQIDYKEGHDF